MFETFEKIKELAKKRGKALGQVEEDLGYGRNTLYKIKNSTPNAERIAEIANYFNVSTDYLLGRTDNPTIASDDTIAGYTSDDLRKMAENAKTFDGKPLTEEDIDAIQNIIEIYLRGR
ncbi:helix-turn-helix domain-containing protein [Streptococcus pneumoniae]|nr:helix-turn-helix domain-containing protein [Streptococcus pneumoniae]MDS8929155.1 helix-turn-helix domain-containing protein [Streptococcus pneumoniae]MDS9177447.1 helix-turn-helix domain-containing protein [Streptococcus pneumoniae]MDS9303362.1 helix-turn-helix domain-containing protein [Streptococcus pneumoniae]VJF02332.1 phage transcriptional regulator, Cro/CI family [Streptococcus pneumoniae]